MATREREKKLWRTSFCTVYIVLGTINVSRSIDIACNVHCSFLFATIAHACLPTA